MERFKQLFKPKARQPFMGLDISAGRVKLLELDGAPGNYRVVSYASETLAAEAIADHQIADAGAVAEAVTRALKRSGTRTRQAAIAVSGPAVISKVIDMPAELDDEEIEQQINFDAEQYIPYAKEEVSLDFQVVSRDPDNARVNRVLLVACRRDNIEMRLAALEMAGIKVRLVDVEEYALQNACILLFEQTTGLDDSDNVAVFDIGSEQTRLTVQRGGASVYSRELAFGGREIAEDLRARYELKDMDQLRARLRTGDIDAESIGDQIAAFADSVAGQIKRALQFFISAGTRDEVIGHVVLAGVGTLYPGFENALRARIDWPASIGNPLAGMPASSAARRNHVELEGPALMVPAGLAVRAAR